MPELANPVYYALADRQAAFGEHRGAAHRFDPDVAPFTALPDEPTADDWDALRHLVGPGRGRVLPAGAAGDPGRMGTAVATRRGADDRRRIRHER